MPNFVAPMIGRGVVLKAPSADGTTGQVLQTDGAGQLSFATVAGGGGVDQAANYNWTGLHTWSQALTIDADVNGDSEKIKFVNEFNAASVSSSIAGYHWNGAAQYKSARLKFRRWASSPNFGDFAIDIGSNNTWSEKLTLDVNGILTVPTLVTTATVSAGTTGNPVGMHYSTGATPGTSVIRHGVWAKDNLDVRFRASGSDFMMLSWDGRLGIGDSSTERTEYDGKLGVIGQAASVIVAQLKAAAAQTADIIQCQNSAGTELFAIEADGSIDQASGAKLGFMGATPAAQKSVAGIVAGFTAGAGTAVKHDSTFTGNNGTTAYTIGDVVDALKQYGLLAA